MNKIERVKNDNYTVISNVFIKDKTLSLKAKGLLCIIMALPKDWNFSINGICSILKESKTSIYSIIEELKIHNYCTSYNKHGDKGKFEGYDYTFYEEPNCSSIDKDIVKQPYGDIPYTENPQTDNPQTENDTQLNKDIINNLNNKVNNKELKKDCDDETLGNKQVNELYDMYPSKCPKRNVSLGKSFKDKDRIKKLLKTHSYEMLKFTIEREISEKYNKSYMANFSTFLNNLPDYGFDEKLKNQVDDKSEKINESIEIDGVTYK